VLGAAIGVPAALVAALFLALVHDLEHWLWHDLPDALGHSSAPSPTDGAGQASTCTSVSPWAELFTGST
jgi:hypothetical protein